MALHKNIKGKQFRKYNYSELWITSWVSFLAEMKAVLRQVCEVRQFVAILILPQREADVVGKGLGNNCKVICVRKPWIRCLLNRTNIRKSEKLITHTNVKPLTNIRLDTYFWNEEKLAYRSLFYLWVLKKSKIQIYWLRLKFYVKQQ